ncbi:hypothetical protein [Blautia sp. MSJ-9]|uniref:hypothetical protein n=1 Tax=Blautia sp. MSJ-9 TaxID=2841511 RepID=UPI00209DA411|nr:hypothetical protein [Blautia sp. MSJ-9]
MTRRDFDGKINVVATVDQTASNSIADAMAPGAEKLMCSTRQEMMEAVQVYCKEQRRTGKRRGCALCRSGYYGRKITGTHVSETA